MSQYVLVQLYTDVIPDRYQPTTTRDENKQFLYEHFGTLELPLYAVVKPDGGKWKALGQYGGKINNVEGFKDFLKKPLEEEKARAELPWTGSLEAGLKKARQDGRPVFVDFTAVSNQNAVFNENLFTKPEIKELLGQYSLVQL